MNNNNPLVSVIVPVYCTEKFLPMCIESICSQTYSYLQIILVDDQSPDNCPKLCEEYSKKDHRIIVIHQDNKGVSGARNTGMDYAKGEYLMFVDSDDELYPNAVETLVIDAKKYSADIVSAFILNPQKETATNIEDDGTCLIYKEEETLLMSLKGSRDTDSACAKLYKTSFVQSIRFDEGKNINEDGFFVFRCYLKKPVLVQHNIAVYKYNFRDNSCSHQTFSDKYFSMLYFCEQKKVLIESCCPQFIKEMHNMEVRTHLQFLDVLCRTNDKKYRDTYKESAKIVRKLYRYHKPINDHHRKLAWIVAHGLYPLYKALVRLKYHR